MVVDTSDDQTVVIFKSAAKFLSYEEGTVVSLGKRWRLTTLLSVHLSHDIDSSGPRNSCFLSLKLCWSRGF